MPSVTLSLAYRPVRIGFVIREGELDDVVRAATICTQLWGGIFNVLVPIAEGDDAADGAKEIVRRYLVDHLIPLAESDSIARFVRSEAERTPSFRFADQEPLVDTGMGGERILAYQDMTRPLRSYWWREGRHGANPQVCEAAWSSSDAASAMYAVSFGRFPTEEDHFPSIRDTFVETLNPWEVDLSGEESIRLTADAVFPLTLTALELGSPHGWGRRDSLYGGVVLGEQRSFDDLVNFWNLRASGFDVIYWPTTGSDVLREWVSARLSAEATKLQPESWGIRFTSLGKTDSQGDHERLQEVARALVSEDTPIALSSLAGGVLTDPYVGGPAPRTHDRTIVGSIEERYGQPGLVAHLAEPPFRESESRHSWSGQLLAWCIERFPDTGSQGWTFSLPFVRELNEWFARQMSPAHPFELRVQPDGIDLIRRAYDDSLEIWPLSEDALVARLFERAGFEMRKSTPGQIADRITTVFGGMRWTSFLRIRGVRNLLAKPAARSGLSFNHAAELIRDRSKGSESFAIFRQQHFWSGTTPAGVMTYLLESGVFRPGLELRCPECQLRPIIEADLVSTDVTCPLCGARFPLAPRIRRAKWVFQLSGVFRREGGPEGAVPSLLAMGEILRSGDVFQRNVMLSAHELVMPDRQCESDFVYLELDRYGRPSICIGECKDHDQIDAEDVFNLNSVRTRLRESGTECYVAFSTLRDFFSPEELDLFRELSVRFKEEKPVRRAMNEPAQSAPPILFTARELEADPQLRPPTDGAPHPYPHGLRELAENSYVAYLAST